MNTKEKLKVVYTSYSKRNFYAREMISAYVLDNDYLPLNPFTNWNYYMSDMVDREKVTRANNNLIYLSQELWMFGEISDGCLLELELAMSKNIKIRFFTVGKTIKDIYQIDMNDIKFEDDVVIGNFLDKLQKYKFL